MLAVAFFAVSLLYLLGVLQIGASPSGHHIKHALLFAVLGVLSLVWMRFQKTSAPGAR